jgi:hypothetical protein
MIQCPSEQRHMLTNAQLSSLQPACLGLRKVVMSLPFPEVVLISWKWAEAQGKLSQQSPPLALYTTP